MSKNLMYIIVYKSINQVNDFFKNICKLFFKNNDIEIKH